MPHFLFGTPLPSLCGFCLLIQGDGPAEPLRRCFGRASCREGRGRAFAMFSMMRMMQNKGMGAGEEERKYWQDMGWLGNARPWKAA